MFRFKFTSDLLPDYDLEDDPQGWEGMRYLQVRDMTYHGVSLTVTATLTFLKKSAQYLRSAYEAKGIEALVVLTVYEEDPNENIPIEVYRGRVDFTTYQTSQNGVQVKLQEGGLTTAFLTRDNTVIDLFSTTSLSGLSLSATRVQPILLHSQALYKQYNAIEPSPAATPIAGYVTDGGSRFQSVYIGPSKVETDEFDLGQLANGPVTTSPGAEVPIKTFQESGLLTIKFDLRTTLTVKQGEEVSLPLDRAFFGKVDGTYYLRHNDTTVATLASFTASVDKVDFVRQIPLVYNGTISITQGDRLYVYGRIHVYEINNDTVVSLGGYSFEVTSALASGSYFKLSAATTTPATTSTGVLVYDAFQRITEAIADRPAFYSEYFGRTDSSPSYAVDGEGSLTLLTGAFQLRGFPSTQETLIVPANGIDPRKSLYASFRALYNSENARHCLGCGVERRDGKEVLRVEPRSFFYQNKVVLKLGRVSDLSGPNPYSEIQYNTLEVGYSKWQSGSANGLDEFNSKRTYTLPLTAVKNTYNAVSDYPASGYLIEEVRRQRYIAGTTEEGQADADNFLISLRRTPSGFVPEKGEPFSRVEGIYSPSTAYNLRYSPARNLRRHGAWLRAGLVKQQDKTIRLGVVEGNDKLVSQLTSESVAVNEHADILVTELDSPYLQAEVYEFTTILRPDQVSLLARQPYGQISFEDDFGNRESGFLLRAEIEPRLKGKASITLLRSYQEGGLG